MGATHNQHKMKEMLEDEDNSLIATVIVQWL